MIIIGKWLKHPCKKEECQYNLDQNLNNVNTLRLILSCVTGNNPKYIIN